MSRIRGKMNLAKLKSVVKKVKGKNGMIDCIIIPIEENDLFLSKKGSVFIDLIAFENDKIKEYTHMLKQSIDGDKYKAMTKDEQFAMPILGNLEYIDDTSSSAPVVSTELPDAKDLTVEEEQSDDLPF
jgi:hypothetical protein